MSKGIRNFLMAMMIFITALVLVLCLGIGISLQNDIYFDVLYDVALEITDVKAEEIGTMYNQKQSRDGMTYYRFDITLKNDTNINVRRYSTSFYFEADTDYVETVYNDGMLSSADSFVIPAGEQGIVTSIVQVPVNSKRIELYTWDKNEERYVLKLK